MGVRGAGLRVALQRRVVKRFQPIIEAAEERQPGFVEDPATDTELGVDAAVRGLRRSGWMGLDGLAVSQLVRKGAPLPEVGQTTFWPDGDGYVLQFRQRYAGAYEMRRTLVGDEFDEDTKAANWLDEASPTVLKALGLSW